MTEVSQAVGGLRPGAHPAQAAAAAVHALQLEASGVVPLPPTPSTVGVPEHEPCPCAAVGPAAAALVDDLPGAHEAGAARTPELGRSPSRVNDRVAGAKQPAIGVEPERPVHHQVGAQQPPGLRTDARIGSAPAAIGAARGAAREPQTQRGRKGRQRTASPGPGGAPLHRRVRSRGGQGGTALARRSALGQVGIQGGIEGSLMFVNQEATFFRDPRDRRRAPYRAARRPR